MAEEKMEVSVGVYGRMMFEVMTGKPESQPDHWESIREEAAPLVEKLLELNDKMKGGGYSIVGRKVKGKKLLSNRQRIKKAQDKLWLTEAKNLKEGDYFWVTGNSDIEMYIGEQEPVCVDEITKKGIYFEMSHCGGHHTEKIGPDEMVYKAPEEFKLSVENARRWHAKEITNEEFNVLRNEAYKKEQELVSEEYWLSQAEKLGF